MPIRSQRFVLPLLGLLFAACATAGTERPSRTEGGVFSRDGAIIISGVALDDGPGSILSAMQGKVPSLRIHRGFCRESLDFATLFTLFNERRDSIYATVRGLEELEEKQRNRLLDYYDKFYDIINNEGRARREIHRMCRRA